MPNLVTNILTFNDSEKSARELLQQVQSDAYANLGIATIDFNKIIPMPPELNIEEGSRTIQGLEQYQAFLQENATTTATSQSSNDLAEYQKQLNLYIQKNKLHPETMALGEKAYQNRQKHGQTSWYSWSLKQWGTKWNAIDFEYFLGKTQSDECRFMTAWSAPHPVIDRLAEMYPDLTITHQWADEDLGQNCGVIEYQNGSPVTEHYPVPGSREAYKFSADVMQIDLSESGYRLSEDGSEYEYYDPEEDATESMGEMHL